MRSSLRRRALSGLPVGVGVLRPHANTVRAFEPLNLSAKRNAATRARDAYLTALRGLDASRRRYGKTNDAGLVADAIAQAQNVYISGVNELKLRVDTLGHSTGDWSARLDPYVRK